MGVVLLTLLVGVLNLCLGYVVAVRLGYGPPSLIDAWEVLAVNGLAQPVAVQEAPPGDSSADAPTQETTGPSLEEMLDAPYDEAYDEPHDEASEEPDNESVSEEPELDSPEDWELDERFVEASVLTLNIAMSRSERRTTDIDTRLRAIQGSSDPQTIRKCRDDLLEDCQTFLAEHRLAAERFRVRLDELGELRGLGEEIEAANLELAAQVETTISNLHDMDFESDLEAANRRLLEEITNLRTVRHKLRDDQQKVFLAIVRYENRWDKIEKQLFPDPLTRLPNRIGLEVTLWQWWEEGCHQSRQMSAALFDLDGFGLINQRFGSSAGDKILHQLAQFIQKTTAQGDLVGRFAGQRFLVVIVDVSPRAAIKNAEFIRQSIERITFLDGDEEIRVTAACGITEVAPDDTPRSLFSRLEQALRQAKQAGPNRSFFHHGEEADVVESPGLGAEYVEIPI